MLLSVIVPAYNIGGYLPKCLNSLLDQDLDPREYEIIVVNDGSQDNTLAVGETVAEMNPNVVVVSQPNQGLSAARNTGIRLAQGTYIYFVDGDDYVEPRVLATLVAVMERDSLEVLGFGHRVVNPEEAIRPVPADHEGPTATVTVTTGSQYLAAHHYMNAVWWYILRRDFLTHLGLAFEVGRFVEDGLFTAKVLCAAQRFAYVPIDVYRYVRRPGSIMQTNSAEHTIKLITDYERVVVGLGELRSALLATGLTSAQVFDRLAYRQQAYVFFLISRLIRSSVPPRPLLPAALARIACVGAYPLTRFPGRDYRGWQYRLLTGVYNRERVLYPFIHLYRLIHRGRPVHFRQQ